MLSLVELGSVALPCEGSEIRCLCLISRRMHIMIYLLGCGDGTSKLAIKASREDVSYKR